MKKLAYSTPIKKLDEVHIGDEITDEYLSQGKVVKIIKNIENGIAEFLFKLDNKQMIYIIRNAV